MIAFPFIPQSVFATILPLAELTADSITNAGVVITALLGISGFLYTLRNNRRASYVAIISDARLEWIVALRSEVSTLLALAHRWNYPHPGATVADAKLWEKIVDSVYKTRLYLTPNARSHPTALVKKGYIDNHLDELIDEFFGALQLRDVQRAGELGNRLLVGTQELIWSEWLKTKIESINGDPHDSIYERCKQRITATIDWFSKQ